MEEGETSTPFWLPPTTTTVHRRSHRLFTFLSFTICTVTLFFIIQFLMSICPDFELPELGDLFEVKRNLNSLCVVLVLLGLGFGFLNRNRNWEGEGNGSEVGRGWFEYSDPMAEGNGQKGSEMSDEVKRSDGSMGRYWYSDRTDVIDDDEGKGSRVSDEVKRADGSMGRGWFGYSDRTAEGNGGEMSDGSVGRNRNGYSDPTDDRNDSKMRNEVKGTNDSMGRGWFGYSDRTAVIDDGNGGGLSDGSVARNRNGYAFYDRNDSKMRNEVKKSDGSVPNGWYEYSDREAVVDEGNGSKMSHEVKRSNVPVPKGWYDSFDRTAVIDERNGSKMSDEVKRADGSMSSVWYDNFNPAAGVDDKNDSKMRNEVKKSDGSMGRGRYEYSDRTADQNHSKMSSGVKESNGSVSKGWYESFDETAGIGGQNGSKIRSDVQNLDESMVTGWYEYLAPSAVLHNQNDSKMRDGVKKSDGSVREGWYGYPNRTALVDDQNHSKMSGEVKNSGGSMPKGSYESFDRKAEMSGQNGTKGTKMRDEVQQLDGLATRVWYEYLEPTVVVDVHNGSKMREEVERLYGSVPKGWYESFDGTAVIDSQNGSTEKDEVNRFDGSKGRHEYSDQMAKINDQKGTKMRDEEHNSDGSVARGWDLYSDQAAAINERNGTKMRNEVHKLDKSMPKEWYQDPDRRNVAGGKTSGPRDSSDKRRFHNDMSSTQKAAEGLATPANVASHLERAKEVKIVNTGTVIGVSNGFARIRGLDKVIAGEIVEFDEGIIGIVMNLVSKDSVDVLLIGDGLVIKEGSFVKATGKMSEIPLNEGHVGKNELDTPPDGTEIKKRNENQAPPRVRRRKRRTANKGLIEERSKWEIESRTVNTGIVLGVAYGLARIQCLDEVVAGEIIEFDEGTIGIALNSDYVILMGDGSMIQEDSLVKATGKIAQMPVSEAWLDRFLSALAKPIDVRSELFGSNPQELEEKEMEKTTDREDESTIIENRESSSFYNPELDRNESVRPKEDEEEEEEEGNEEMSDELEYNGYDSSSSSSPVMAQDFPLSPPRGIKTEKKRGGNATRDFLTSLGIKKKQRQKSVENIEFQPPPPPPPPSSIQSFFSTKKAKGKRVISIPPPHEQKSVRVESPPATMRRPPLPVKTRTFVEVAAPTSGGESQVTGAESPLHPIPAPPPPPFQMPGWKFAVKGDYVKIASANTSRSVSPERDEVDTPRNSDYGDVATGSSMFCPSPDVNSKADMFIANFRAGLKLQKMNSMKQKQGVGLSNLGPVSEPNQAKA